MGQFAKSSARVITTCRPTNSHGNMNGFMSLALFALLASGASAAGPNRKGKNLRETFPFNQHNGQAAGHAAHDHHHEHEHAHAHQAVDARASRQGGGDVSLDIGSIAAAGERCIDKVVMVEETEYDDVIEYKTIASEEKIQFCNTPLICDGEGPIECKTVYESQCETRYHEHEVEDDVVSCETIQEEKCEDVTQGYTTEQKCTKWPKQVCTSEKKVVKKYTPETECKKVPRELCGPSGCELKPGPEECFDKKETVVQEVPEETC